MIYAGIASRVNKMPSKNPTPKQLAARKRFAANAKRAARLGKGKTKNQRAQIRKQVFGASKKSNSSRKRKLNTSRKRKPAKKPNGMLLAERKKKPNKANNRRATARKTKSPNARKAGVKRAVNKTQNCRRNSRKRNQGGAAELHQEFLGRPPQGSFVGILPEGSPKEVAMLGELVLIKTTQEEIEFDENEAMLCADADRRLYIATDETLDPYDDLGEIKRIDYMATKDHMDDGPDTIYFHKLGEEGGERPKLITDHDGAMVIAGGDYSIESAGLVN